MIVAACAPRSVAAVARVFGRREKPCWLCTPGDRAGHADADVATAPLWHFVACDPVAVVRGDGVESVAALDQAWARARSLWSDGGAGVRARTPVAVGYLSYDLGRAWHGLPAPSMAMVPDGDGAAGAQLEFRFYDAFWVQPPDGAPEIWATDAAAAEGLCARLRDADRGSEADPRDPDAGFALSRFSPVEPPSQHLAAVTRVRDYLHAGDAYQVNLARRLHARLTAAGPPGLALFTRLLDQAPAPHAIWLADGASGSALIGNSPERFLALSPDGWLETAPIKGTRPRERDAAGDEAAAAALHTDAKDRAEHVMIVDLQRNDLGRICDVGSVQVASLLQVMKLPSVFHLVSTVRGHLRSGTDLPAILAATFPGGSITGAPKRRAMQIIDELEAAPRGPYTGATGWLGAAGDFDLAVAIRTALLARDQLTLWVGGGIVVDSTPEGELFETEVKARAFAALCDGDRQG